MGWYDAFKKTDVANIDTKALSGGSAMSAFGDAFKGVGSAMVQDDALEQQKKVDAAKIASSEASTASAEQATENSKYTLEQTRAKDTQKTFDDAFKRDVALAKNPQDLVTKFGYTQESMQKLSPEAMKFGEDYYQANFNSEAISSATGYKTFDAFKQANPKLIEMADGVTVAKIDKYYRDNDLTLSTLSAKEKDIKHATSISKMQNKLNALAQEKNKTDGDKVIKDFQSYVLKSENLDVDKYGNPIVGGDSLPRYDFIMTRGMEYKIAGKNSVEARNLALQDWEKHTDEANKEQEVKEKKEKKKNDVNSLMDELGIK